jgi:hypothetical protein
VLGNFVAAIQVLVTGVCGMVRGAADSEVVL